MSTPKKGEITTLRVRVMTGKRERYGKTGRWCQIPGNEFHVFIEESALRTKKKKKR